MKKNIFFLLALCAFTYLTGCSEEQKKQESPKPRVYTVAQDVFGMNITIDGRDINIETNKGGGEGKWIGQSSRSWGSYNGKPSYVAHSIAFRNIVGDALNNTAIHSNLTFNTPYLYINPDDLNGSYTYATMRNMFKVGNYPIRTSQVKEGYHVMFSHVNQIEPEKSFGYSTIHGSQEGSKWEIVAVQEKPNNSVLVTYHIDCNVYDKDLVTKRKMIGTIQVQYWYDPFIDAPTPIGG
jgi:hypothetical protein